MVLFFLFYKVVRNSVFGNGNGLSIWALYSWNRFLYLGRFFVMQNERLHHSIHDKNLARQSHDLSRRFQSNQSIMTSRNSNRSTTITAMQLVKFRLLQSCRLFHRLSLQHSSQDSPHSERGHGEGITYCLESKIPEYLYPIMIKPSSF